MRSNRLQAETADETVLINSDKRQETRRREARDLSGRTPVSARGGLCARDVSGVTFQGVGAKNLSPVLISFGFDGNLVFLIFDV